MQKAAIRTGTKAGNDDAQTDASSRDHLNNKLFFRLFQAANIYETQAVREMSLSAVMGATLGALSRDVNGMLFSDLYGYLGVSRQNLDAVLKGLEKKGLVERIEVENDRRKRIVCLTPAGVEAWKDVRRRSIDFFRRGTKGISTTEVADCAETLSRIGRALRAMQSG